MVCLVYKVQERLLVGAMGTARELKREFERGVHPQFSGADIAAELILREASKNHCGSTKGANKEYESTRCVSAMRKAYLR